MADQDSVTEAESVSQDEPAAITHISQLPPYVPEEIQGEHGIKYITYSSEAQLPLISKLMEADLSEPYSVFTYRYFMNQWPKLTWLVRSCKNINFPFCDRILETSPKPKKSRKSEQLNFFCFVPRQWMVIRALEPLLQS
jgi:hypothetical protein